MPSKFWQTDKIICDFSNKSSNLYKDYTKLAAYFKSKINYVVLLDAQRQIDVALQIANNNIKISDINDNKISENIEQMYNTSFFKNIDDQIYISLNTKEAYMYGVFITDRTKAKEDFIKKDSLLRCYKKYCQTLYSYFSTEHLCKNKENILSVQNVSVEYNSSKKATIAVNDVSFNVDGTDFLVILGPSGCGKTSLLNSIGALVQPRSGKILWKGENICEYSDAKRTKYRRHDIGFIFQNYNLIQDLTTFENVNLAAKLVNDSLPIHGLLEQLNIADKEDFLPTEMSGGEQQRVCVARALIKNSKMLLCDEPTGALDSKNAWQLMDILQKVSIKGKIPVIVITHNPEFAALASHLIYMKNGKIHKDILCPFMYTTNILQDNLFKKISDED